jgi:hypothetical protein
VILLVNSGVAIGIFKTGALALIGDISQSTVEHTATMNTVEGFFAVGAIIGPAIVAHLLAGGTSWKWLSRDRRDDLFIAHRHGLVCEISANSREFRVRRSETHTSDDEEPVCSGLLSGDILICHRRKRGLCVDADAACRLPPTADLGGHLRDFDLFCPPRRWEIHRVLGSRPLELGNRRYHIQPRHTSLLRDIDACRSSCSYSSSAVVGPFHVRAVSHAQLERHQLFSQAGTWRSVRSDSVFHMCGGCVGTTGDPKYGFVLATVFAALLFAALLLNQIFNPARNRLQRLDQSEYEFAETQSVGGQARS